MLYSNKKIIKIDKIMKIPKFLLLESIFNKKNTLRYSPGVFNYSIFLSKVSFAQLFLVLLRKLISKITPKVRRFPIEIAGVAGGISIYHRTDLSGEGFNLVFDYIRAFNQSIEKPINTLLEIGSGPGYLGFTLLGLGYCKELMLVDINPKAIEVIKKTIKENNLNSVKYYLSDALENVPDDSCDLIISNPVHFDDSYKKKEWRFNTTNDLIAYDKDWEFHKKLYGKASKILRKNGKILLQENGFAGDNTDIYKKMISNGEGNFISKIDSNKLTPESPMYYILSSFND